MRPMPIYDPSTGRMIYTQTPTQPEIDQIFEDIENRKNSFVKEVFDILFD